MQPDVFLICCKCNMYSTLSCMFSTMSKTNNTCIGLEKCLYQIKNSLAIFFLFIKIIRYKIIFRNGVCEEIVSFENEVMLLTD